MRSPRFPLAVAALLLAAASARADELRPAWECLPAETVALVRLPRSAAFLEAVREQTRFGAIALAPERIRQVWEMLVPRLWPADPDADAAEGAAKLDELLGRYGLTQADLAAAFAGDAGAAVVLKSRGDGLPPVAMLVAWIEPGPAVAERLMAASKQAAEELVSSGDEPPARRTDIGMAGHEVVWLAQPVMQIVGSITVDGERGEEQLRDIQRQAAEQARKTKPVQVGLTHGFTTRIGGRLLMAQTLPTTDGRDVKVDAGPDGRMRIEVSAKVSGEPEDVERLSGGDEARAIFEQFLAAHATADEAPLSAVMQAPGMQESLPAGITLLDMMVDLGGLVRRLAGDQDGSAVSIEAVGIEDVGPLAWRHTLDGDVYRQGLFVSLPAPRQAAMRILEQETDAAEVPTFVTSEAVGLTQISLDLGKAYQTIREIAVARGGEETANMFTVAEMQTQGWMGLDLAGVLSAFGTRHWVVSYPPQVAAALAEARKARKEPGPLGAMPAADRLALVWKVNDEAPFLKIMQRLAPMAKAEIVEEQGFRGIRIPDGPAVFVGQQHLVVAVGGDALEKTLAAIRTPPAGEASLRESAAVTRAAAILPPAPARLFSLGDATRTGGMLGIAREIVASLEAGDVAPAYRELLAKIQPLLPSAAEMEGMFGVSTSLLEATDTGLSYRSAWEMPAP